MNVFTRSVSQVLKGAGKAFQTFPAAILCAAAFAIVTMVRIQLDWPQQEAYNFLLNCLHWGLALGAIFSLAAITFAQSRSYKPSSFVTANILGIVAAVIAVLALYLFGASDPAVTGSRYAVVSALAAARVSVVMFISFMAFIYLAGFPEEQSDFARSFFMTHKAFFIALLYGGVLEAGASGVAGAIQALLYPGMSEKVYMYIATLIGFLAFTIFVGYFPDFRIEHYDERREIAQKQPRFIEVLFEYILVPVILAMTVVLLLWAGRTILSGMVVNFAQLAGIATSFTMSGIWLYIMVTHNQSGMAKFFRRVYPIAALVILGFEAWALYNQLGKYGLKMTEYNFAIVWTVALFAALLLLFIKDKAYPAIVAFTCTIVLVAVLPVVGYQALPVSSQVNRLENLLLSQDMLKDNQIVPAAAQPEEKVRESITDAVSYLASAPDAQLPSWFDRKLNDSQVFKSRLGFDQTWPKPEVTPGPAGYLGTSLQLPTGAMDIQGYRWVVTMGPTAEKARSSATVQGARGTYEIYWTMNSPGVPSLKITLGDNIILDQDLNSYVDQITAKYPPAAQPTPRGTFEDMSLKLETPELNVLLVFNNIDINVDVRNDQINYWFNLNAIYLNEKP